MTQYRDSPASVLPSKDGPIHSFLQNDDPNIDWGTVKSFGSEWNKFNTFSDEEIEKIGLEYFDLVDDTVLNKNTVALDIGCGSGRFSKFICGKARFVEAIDPSSAVFTAKHMLRGETNVRVTQASLDFIPFPDESFDLVFCLGVLHHVPRTEDALKKCVAMVKPGGHLLVYLYYDLENRGFLFRILFKVSNLLRRLIARFPTRLKHLTCELIGFFVYFPLASFAYWVSRTPLCGEVARLLPLYYYHDKSLGIMRNDALDRFGTPLERRFSKHELEKIMLQAGLRNIVFSDSMPHWHLLAQK